MSKQHTKPSTSNRLRRGLACLLSLALLIGLLPAAVIPAQAAEHWATPYVNTLVDWGVMRGDISGNMAPERSITRAEFVAMMNRAYGYTRTAGHPFTDVRVRDWYNDDIDIGYNMGYFKGTSPTTASPNAALTREQAAVLLARNMMLQPTVGETLGFSDSRTLSDWSRGLVGAAAANGILGGYNDGSFKPQTNISRGEVAAMLVRAIGTPIQEEGDHTLGNVYGNVTVNTSGVKLRDGVITGNLYLTGGIDLGDVLMENVTVLGDIVVSGAGESNSSQSSIVLRNVTADSMTVASISDQFVTIRAEGNTDIKTTTVRTNAYVDDSSLDGYGLWKIIQDGGSLLQLAGNIKEVVNKTPNSDLQVVQGVASKVTIDEKATGSTVLVDGDARVDELDLDVATTVTGDGDIKNLNVAAAGSTVEQLPDTITIRPGITADINGSTMNNTQAAEASSEPMLLAGYPRAKNVAPTTATLVFSVNKPGTIYWAISAVSDGSVGEADLIENPAYGGKIVKSGTISAAKASTEYTASVTGLTQDGSYYISAILVDGRDKRSPVKVAAFTTPDGTAPAFVGNPTATLRSTKTAQVTGMPNKSCQLFWALLPENATAPTPAEFKANAVRGNLGYGSMDVTKNVSQSVNVNRGALKEKTNYVAYLWLTDYDGAKSSQVYRVPIYIPDETPPEVSGVRQSNSDATSVEVSFTMNETGKLYWAIVTDEMHEKQSFISYDEVVGDPSPATEATNAYLSIENENTALSSKVSVVTGVGAGAIVAGNTPVNTAGALTQVLMAATRGLDPEKYNTSTFYMYYVGEDSEKPGNLSKTIGVKEINVKDVDSPVLEAQRFDDYNPNDLEHPLSTTSVSLVFSESIRNDLGSDRENRFWDLYQKVATLVDQKVGEDHPDLVKARDDLAKALYNCIKLYEHVEGGQREVTSVRSSTDTINPDSPPVLNYRYATVTKENGTSRMIINFPYNTVFRDSGGNVIHSAQLKSGATYHFELSNIYDCAAPTPNALQSSSDCMKDYLVDSFRVAFARVSLDDEGILPAFMQSALDKGGNTLFEAEDNKTDQGALTFPYNKGDGTTPAGPLYNPAWDNNQPQRIDGMFNVTPLFVPSDLSAEDGTDSPYDILVWANSNMQISLYSRAKTSNNAAPWTLEGTVEYKGTGTTTDGYVYKSLMRDFRNTPSYDNLSTMPREGVQYAIHVDWLLYAGENSTDFASWDKTVDVRVSVVAGSNTVLNRLYASGGTQTSDTFNDAFDRGGMSSLGIPDTLQTQMIFKRTKVPDIISVNVAKSDPTRPQITVTLDNPGHVNYLLVPLTYDRLRYEPWTANPEGGDPIRGDETTMPSTKRITSDMLSNPQNDFYITRYIADTTISVNGVQPSLGDFAPINGAGAAGTMGLVVERPLASAIGSGGEFASPMQQGYTADTAGNRAQTITLKEDLTPNTLYLLFLVPVGNREAEVTRAFYFITDPVSAPVLTLGERGSINVNAGVNMTANVHARLLVQDNLDRASTIFDELLGDTDPDGNSNWNPDSGFADGPYKDYTVRQALQQTYNPEGKGRSIFDVFASDTLKGRLANLVETGTITGANPPLPGNTFYDNWQDSIQVPNGATANSKPTEFKESQADAFTTYFCIGIAYVGNTEGTGPWGFRALEDLTLVDDTTPRISNISHTLHYDKDHEKIDRGSVTITYTTYLYLGDSDTEKLPLLNLSMNPTGMDPITATVTGSDGKTKYYPLGNWMPEALPLGVSISDTNKPYRVTQSISFKIDTIGMPGDTFMVTLPQLWSQWGRSTSQLTIEIEFLSEDENGKQTWRVNSPKAGSDALVAGYNPNAR